MVPTEHEDGEVVWVQKTQQTRPLRNTALSVTSYSSPMEGRRERQSMDPDPSRTPDTRGLP